MSREWHGQAARGLLRVWPVPLSRPTKGAGVLMFRPRTAGQLSPPSPRTNTLLPLTTTTAGLTHSVHALSQLAAPPPRTTLRTVCGSEYCAPTALPVCPNHRAGCWTLSPRYYETADCQIVSGSLDPGTSQPAHRSPLCDEPSNVCAGRAPLTRLAFP